MNQKPTGLARYATPLWRIALPSILGGVVATVVFLALRALTEEISVASIVTALSAISAWQVAAALILTFMSFLTFGVYDVIAVRSAHADKVPTWLAMLTGMAGTAMSNMLGFGFVTGAAPRVRIYGGQGLSPTTIGNVLGLSWASYWVAIALSAGLLLIIAPGTFAAELGISQTVSRVLGCALAAPVLLAFVLAGREGRVIRFRTHVIHLPTRVRFLAQTAAGLVDVGAASMALYVLMPQSLEVGPAAFFVAFIIAFVVGLISRAPGGLGAFEATLLATLSLGGRSDVVAALVLYRLIYYVLPFALATIAMTGLWVAANREGVGARASRVAEIIGPFVPPLAAGAAVLAGAILLVSGSLPGLGAQHVLSQVAPLGVIEFSHILGSTLGVILIVLSRGLLRREVKAWRFAFLVLLLTSVGALLTGFHWQRAIVLLSCAAVLFAFRASFYRHADRPLRLSARSAAGAALVILATVFLAEFAHKDVAYAHDLWWQFAWDGDASRSMRAAVAAAVTLAVIGAMTLLAPPAPSRAAEPIPDDVRAIVAAAPQSDANLALLGDKRFLISPHRDAVIMYAATRDCMIAKGDPLGDRADGEALAWSFLETADRAGVLPAFYAVGTDYLPTYLDMGLSVLKIGEVARVKLQAFSLEGSHRKDMRYARSRAKRDGLSFSIVQASEVPPLLDELERVSDAWLEHKQGEEKSFALGRFDLSFLANFDHAVLRSADGRLIAFANLWQSGQRHEVAVDLMRHDPDAPRIAMLALFVEIMLWAKDQGYAWFSLGAAPFAGMSSHPHASHWNRIGAFVYAHGEEFYHFEGLRRFKQQFDPEWTPNYIACPGGLAAARILMDVNTLISGGARGIIRRTTPGRGSG